MLCIIPLRKCNKNENDKKKVLVMTDKGCLGGKLYHAMFFCEQCMYIK